MPGKPATLVAGRPLLLRTIDMVRRARRSLPPVDVLVATDDRRVAALAEEAGCAVTMTAPDLSSGTARVLAGALPRRPLPTHVVNVQGDAAFTPTAALAGVVTALLDGADVATPAVQLDWNALDAMRAHKRTSPFSGTTVTIGADGDALWFSKKIIPAIREEERLRADTDRSPIFQHIGLYGYSLQALTRFAAAPPTRLELLEGLEQLRFLDLKIPIRIVETAFEAIAMGGIDTPADVHRAEQLIARFGDPFGR